MKALVTGCAGFIGSHLSERLVAQGASVVGVDCFTDLYPRSAKERNLEWLLRQSNFSFWEANLLDCDLDAIVAEPATSPSEGKVELVIFHLAAQPGVRSSWGADFRVYTEYNILATQRLLEWSKDKVTAKFVYASSSSVYGDTRDLPMTEDSRLRPVSPYGVTKLAAEHLGQLYWSSYGVPVVSLRYFSVYGPRQRPDMGFHRFIRAALRNEEIEIYGDGSQTRDFTYIDDVVDATIAAAQGPDGRVFNIGSAKEFTLKETIGVLEELTGKRVKLKSLPEQRGDVRHTFADISKARRALNYHPQVGLRDGLEKQIEWLRGTEQS